MQTAEEILLGKGIRVPGRQPKNFTPLIEAMKIYAKQACEEQVYKCYEAYDSAKGTPDEIGGKILAAPLPELK